MKDKNHISVSKKVKVLLLVIWAVCAIVFAFSWEISRDKEKASMAMEEFSSASDVIVNEEHVGAYVTLKEAIHGTDGILYRYIIKTTCPGWDYEDRYATKTPISWATDDTAAVEVVIYDTQVRCDGTVYANGVYYSVPLFGNMSSEDMPFEEWEQNLVKQAYAVYVSDTGAMSTASKGCLAGMIGIPALLIVIMVIPTKKKKEEDPTDFLDR